MKRQKSLSFDANGRAVCAVRIINEKLNKMNESIIIQKLIQVGQMLERGKLEYSGAEIDTKHYLEQYIALRQPSVVGQSEQLVCDCGNPNLTWYGNDDDKTYFCFECKKEVTN